MRTTITLFLCFCTLLAIACAKASAHNQASSTNNGIVKAFLDALNSKKKETILSFVKDNCSEKLQAKADRMVGVSEMGAPFKLVSLNDGGDGKLTAKLEDANGVPVTLQMTIVNGKIDGLSLRADMAPSKDYSGWSDLSALEESIRTDTDSPAMSLAVLHDGKVDTAASGVREEGKPDRVTADDVFSIGSIGKSVCSTIIGRLIEMGKLRWDETLAEALPNTPMKDAYKTVTLDEILHHRGGIPQVLGIRKPQVDKIVNGATEPAQIRENFVRDVLSQDPIGKPNEKFAYSNGGYAILGHIAESAMGKPYETLVKEMIFQPLGMSHSFTGADNLPTSRPSGHVRPDGPNGGSGGGSWQPMNFTGPMEKMFAPAGGGIYCSASDMLKFGQMHMDGLNGKDGLLKAATIQRLHQGVPEDLVVENASDLKPAYTATPDSRLYACGWGIEAMVGIETMHTHNGSNGTQRAQLAIFPKSGVVVVAFVNCGGETEPSPPLQACLAVALRYAKQ